MRNKKLAELFRGQPCEVCKSPAEGDHIIALGMGGSKKRDAEWNLWALCRLHHREKHDTGLTRFVEKYRLWWRLKEKGFFWLEGKNRYWHQEA